MSKKRVYKISFPKENPEYKGLLSYESRPLQSEILFDFLKTLKEVKYLDISSYKTDVLYQISGNRDSDLRKKHKLMNRLIELGDYKIEEYKEVQNSIPLGESMLDMDKDNNLKYFNKKKAKKKKDAWGYRYGRPLDKYGKLKLDNLGECDGSVSTNAGISIGTANDISASQGNDTGSKYGVIPDGSVIKKRKTKKMSEEKIEGGKKFPSFFESKHGTKLGEKTVKSIVRDLNNLRNEIEIAPRSEAEVLKIEYITLENQLLDAGFSKKNIDMAVNKYYNNFEESLSRKLINICEDTTNNNTTTTVIQPNPGSPGNKVIATTAKGDKVTVEDAQDAMNTINNLVNTNKIPQSTNVSDIDGKISDLTR